MQIIYIFLCSVGLVIYLKGEAFISMFSLEGVTFMASKGGWMDSIISFLTVFHLVLILTLASKYIVTAKGFFIPSSKQSNSNHVKK